MRKPAIAFALPVFLTICATAHAAITGSVVDLEGKPIAGATVRAFAAEGSDVMRARLVAGKTERDPVVSVQSAENGSFSIELKTPGAVDVTIEAPSRRRMTIPTVDGDDLGSVILASPSARTIRVTSGGKPVANAIVVSGLDVDRTKASGEVPAEIGGSYIVVHPDYAISSRGGLANATEIKLSRGVAVRGRVVKGADPVAHAIVSIDGWPLAETGDDGTFAIAHAPDGWKSITAIHGSDVGSANRSKAASVEIPLAPGATFTGTVRELKHGVAVAGARMTLSGPDDTSAIALTDAKGSFTFASLLPRSYSINGMHPSFAIEQASVALPAKRSRVFTAQPFARARGHVLDEDKKPVAAAFVSAGSPGLARGRSTSTNAAGEFAVRITTTASFSLPLPVYAWKRDYVTGNSPSRVWQPGEVRDNVNITLVHGFVAQVRVLDKRERPVPNAQVNVSRSAAQGADRSFIACADPSLPDCHRTNAEGLVAVRTIEGRHDLMVFGDDVAPVRMPNQVLSARTATVVVHVDRGIEISGRVVLADGTPVADAIVETPTGIMPRNANTGSDGTFRIAGIAPGATMVTAFSSDRRLSSTPRSVTAPASDVTITMPRGARVEGRILDRATQQPVTDFTILLPGRTNPNVIGPGSSFSGGQPIHADDGHYALDNIPPGQLQLMVHATGYVAATRGDITVEDGKTVSGIDISLDRGASLSGRVTSASAPVSGAQVRVAFQRAASFGNVTTDGDGLYSLEGLAEGDQTIEFQKQGFVVLRKPVTITAGKDQHLDAELDPGRELHGRVVDHSGQGIAMANIATVGGDGRPLGMVTSDGEGSFVLQGLADGSYKVTARKDGYVSADASDVVLPQSGPVTLTMETGATINGRVTGIPPEQFTQVTVTASGNTTRNQAFADSGGNFTLTGMPDGRVRVDAFLNAAGQRRMAPYKTITIENGVAPAVEMNFDAGITISGHVTRAGGLVTTGSVLFVPSRQPGIPPSADRQVANAMISSDGSYIASGLSTGDYDVRVNAPNVAFGTKYTVAASGTFDIDIRGALLRGHVVDASTGGPVSNARVTVASRLPAYGSASTDSDGRFTVDALADATYDMNVSSDQYVTSSQQIVVANGAVPDVEIRLEQGPAVLIHVVDATTGSPIDGNVAVTDAAHKFNGQATKVDTGTFKVWLKPGSYNASAYARGYVPRMMSFTTPPAEVSVAISRAGSLLIRARSAQMVRLDVPGGVTQRFLGPIQIGLNGPYDSLPPGSYLLSTIGADRTVIRSLPVMIVAGETATIDLP
jgi:protocatechuate 3,4-dioxygenase beta subunit/5-hydroxyisourate hydrolase-like protein (transthyretin family)